ncbi:MAG TPA: response regulator transcription factor [Streptosporangiaceae bacterium]
MSTADGGAAIRVLIVDDDALVRSGLRLMLRSAPDITVAGEAADGAEAITAAAALTPDVVLMDIRMPGTDGVTATAAITTRGAAPRIIALTTFDADDLVRKAITAGAAGYLVKDTPPAEIIGAIRAVAAGQGVLSPAVTRPLLDLLQGAPPDAPAPAAPSGPGLDVLSDRERAVAVAVADGATNAQIASQLYVSPATVKATVSRILTKLNLENRVQIAVIVRNSR